MQKKINSILIICLYFSIILLNCHFAFPTDDPLSYDLIQNETSVNKLNIKETAYAKSDFYTTSTSSDWNRTSDSFFDRNFQIEKVINQTTPKISLENCSNWNLKGSFNFTNLRSEKIINGNAEADEILWTEYIPANYEGNVTRENSPPIGQPLSGNYSWYFDIQSENHTTIVGFDEPINVSSDSVIFSFSYSLLRNNLGTNYDSSVCIRLFFQFDIYIFIWFNGDTGALSNVTGPGGYADLLINEATFDGAFHTYTLNISALGLEMFNQKPDRLRSFAVQTWGELPYQMDFMLDDISLTDLINPTEVNLEVNEQEVFGSEGTGFITLLSQGSSVNDFIISSSEANILWNCKYEISGSGRSGTRRSCAFESWQQILWEETFNKTVSFPKEALEIQISKWIPNDWIIDAIVVNEVLASFTIENSNSTHKEIVLSTEKLNLLEMQFYSGNEITNLLLNNYQVSHDDSLTITIDSNIYNQKIMFYIFDSNNKIIFADENFTDSFGNGFLTSIKFNSTSPKGVYSVIAFWSVGEKIGIGKNTFEIITFPTTIHSKNLLIVNYKQDFYIEIDYQSVEDNSSIDYALVQYFWDFGSGNLLQNINKKYSSKITPLDAMPGLHSITIVASRENYATSIKIITIEIVFEGFQLQLQAPTSMIPGGVIEATSLVLDNDSLPVSDIKVGFKVNGELFLETWSNESGFALMYYFVPLDYSYLTLNLSSSVLIGTTEFLTSTISVVIDLSSVPRLALLSEPIQKTSSNTSVLFNFEISYPSIGNNWYVNVPFGFNPSSAIIQFKTGNISAFISPFGIITWNREITNFTVEHDLLLLEIPVPSPKIVSTVEKQTFSIEISIDTNGVPFSDLEITIPRSADSLQYAKWDLFLNGSLVTTLYKLKVTQEFFTFRINSSKDTSHLTFMLVGSRLLFNQIPFASIFLGLGILILTGISVLLLVKRRRNPSLDILQV